MERRIGDWFRSGHRYTSQIWLVEVRANFGFNRNTNHFWKQNVTRHWQRSSWKVTEYHANPSNTPFSDFDGGGQTHDYSATWRASPFYSPGAGGDNERWSRAAVHVTQWEVWLATYTSASIRVDLQREATRRTPVTFHSRWSPLIVQSLRVFNGSNAYLLRPKTDWKSKGIRFIACLLLCLLLKSSFKNLSC